MSLEHKVGVAVWWVLHGHVWYLACCMVDLWGWICWKSRGEQWHNLGNLLQGHLRSISQVAACWLSVKKKGSWDRKWGTEKEREIFVEFSSILGLSPIRTVWSSQLRNSCGALRWHWNQLTKILDASSVPNPDWRLRGSEFFAKAFEDAGSGHCQTNIPGSAP